MKYLWLILIASMGFAGEIGFDRVGPNRIGHLKLEMDQAIDQSTYLYVKFALEEFRKIGSPFVVLELDTPGGEVFAAQKIAHLLHESDVRYGMPVVAYINNWAISAGAMLAYSCRYIAVSPSASMGAAEPVTMQSGAMESAPEKINSALRSEFSNLAMLYGRNPWIAEAMVDKDLILVRRDGEFVKLDEASDFRSGDEMISQKGKLLTLNGSQLRRFGIADFEVPFAAEEGLFQIAPFKEIPNRQLIGYSNWKIQFFSLLAHPAIASLLMMGLMIGFYLEIQSGGFGWPACLGLTCLGLILLSNFATYAVDWLEIVLIAAGAALLLVEIFVLPTFGLCGAFGAVLLLAGLFALGRPELRQVHFSFDLGNWNLAAHSIWQGMGWFSATLLASFGTVALGGRYLLPRLKRFASVEDTPSVPLRNWPERGREGTVFSPCRPAGQVQIGEEIFEASSEWGFIDKGEKIIIVGLDSNRIVVRAIK